ncbi:MAG: hypothetical protein P4L56_20190 [Candidatus Sulfopaludibacter sp.]|nr:hypothetical protein [Candidatus Sulfopaludibacter sp.]
MPFVYIAAAVIFVVAIARLANIYIPMPGTIKAVINIVLTLIVVGMVLWVINTYIPMAGPIKVLLNVVVFVATCVGVLQAVGLWDSTVRLWHDFRNRATREATVRPVRTSEARPEPGNEAPPEHVIITGETGPRATR